MKDDPLFVKLGKLRNHKGSMLQAADMVIGTNVTFCEACSGRSAGSSKAASSLDRRFPFGLNQPTLAPVFNVVRRGYRANHGRLPWRHRPDG